MRARAGALRALRPLQVGQALALMAEMTGRGGLAVGDGDVRVALLPDGVTILRCAAPGATVADDAARLLAGVAARIEAAASALRGCRAAADLLAGGVALAVAAAAVASAPPGWEAVVRPSLVALCYAALVPLRRPVLRWGFRQALAWAGKGSFAHDA